MHYRRPRKKLRKGFLIVSTIILLCVAGLAYWVARSSEQNRVLPPEPPHIHAYEDDDFLLDIETGTPDTPLVSIPLDSLNPTGYLELVNHQHGFGGLDHRYLSLAWPTVPVSHIEGLYVHQTALAAAQTMFASFREEHPDSAALFVSSGYRDIATQAQLYADNYGSGYVMPAGHSEHHTGLAMDIFAVGVGQWDFGNSYHGLWLAANAYQYGFILRYPAGAEALTGINFEPWHFRYVGYPHAYIMHRRGIVLEEYIDYLSYRGYFSFTLRGARYHVLHQMPEAGMIYVPQDKDFVITYDNTGGVVVLWNT